jgi:hypothetical protein
MQRDALLQRLAATLLAAGLLSGAACSVFTPAEQTLYGPPAWEEPPAPTTQAPSLDQLESAVDEVLTYADTPEGQDEQARDPQFRQLVEELRAIKASVNQRREGDQAPPADPEAGE